MNNDDFEKKLHELTNSPRRPDPTAAWKADILARARREADAIPINRMLPPPWLMVGWAAAWAVILAMNFSTPRDATTGVSAGIAASDSATPRNEVPTLLAFHQRMNLNLDLP
jgi:hypothetical protein